MVIIAKSTIDEFVKLHPESNESLNHWYKTTQNANWSNFHDAKNTFNSIDAVGNDRYVFNIKGNDFRLIALMLFKVRTLFILWVGTHSAYDKINNTIGAKNVEYKN